MATLTWTAASSGLWATATNWSPNQVPTTGDTAFVTVPGAYLITLPAVVDTAALTLDDAQADISVGGMLNVDSALTITAGTLAVAGTLTASGFSNTGTLLNSGTITLDGTVTATSLVHIGGSGGLLTINGTVANTGGTLDGTPLKNQTLLSLGTVEGGTIVNLATAGANSTTLDDVTWRGPLTTGQSLTVSDGITLTGTDGIGSGTLIMGGAPTYRTVIEFTNTQTLDGVTVSPAGTILADDTLTIGSNATFSQQLANTENTPLLFFDGDTVINHGIILGQSSDGHGPVLTNNGVLFFRAADFENFGMIDGRDMSYPDSMPGHMMIEIVSSTFDNRAGGLIEMGQSFGVTEMTVSATTAFTNDGTLLTQDTAPTSIAGGTIDIAAFLAGSGTVELKGNGLVKLEGATASTQSIDFAGAGTLVLNQPAFVSSSINGFAIGDDISLGVAATGVSYSDGDLKMQLSGGSTFDLAVTGTHTFTNFIISTQSSSTDIQLACFASGTRLATARGMPRVEDLRVGDTVLLADRDESLPVVWIGHRTVDCRRHPVPRAVWPVRIAAGAFARGVPSADLYLSPDHAVFVNGVLIPVKYLMNGRSIMQHAVERVEYWHVELPRHAVLRAEGLSVESLLPGSDRSGFNDGSAVVTLHPHWNWDGCGYAPLVVAGPELDAVRSKFAGRVLDAAA